jgi:OOP family OmpA-OmpF porin
MIRKLIAAATLAFVAASSQAAEPGKMYAGVDVGTSRFDHGLTQTSYGAFTGYQFTPAWALEGGYRRLYDSNAWGMNASGDQLSLSVVGSHPLTEAISVYGRLGVSRLSEQSTMAAFEYKGHSTRVLPGLGVSYKVSDNVSARVELQRPTSHLHNLSAGVAYSF